MIFLQMTQFRSFLRLSNIPLYIIYTAAAAAKSLQSCPTLCDPKDDSPPGSPIPEIPPGKNTGVDCHFLLQCMKAKSESEVAQLCLTLSDPMDCKQGTRTVKIAETESWQVGSSLSLEDELWR